MKAGDDKPYNSNRTRDHLANERTYLAWTRTSIALIGFGLLMVRLREEASAISRGALHEWQIGLLFCLAGLGAVAFATAHYFQVQQAIESDTFQPERRWILACSLIIISLGAGVIWYVLSA
jgi:putative membrane protein